VIPDEKWLRRAHMRAAFAEADAQAVHDDIPGEKEQPAVDHGREPTTSQ